MHSILISVGEVELFSLAPDSWLSAPASYKKGMAPGSLEPFYKFPIPAPTPFPSKKAWLPALWHRLSAPGSRF